MEISMQDNPQPKLKAFQTIQKSFAIAGFDRNLVTQSVPLNGKILLCFSLLGLGITFICVYTFNNAESFSEYTQSIYMTTAGILVSSTLIVLILKVKNVFEFINHFDSIINTSELDFEIKKLYCLLEWSRVLHCSSKMLFFLLSNINFSFEIFSNEINLR